MSVVTEPQRPLSDVDSDLDPPAGHGGATRWAELEAVLASGRERWRAQWKALLLILAVFLGFYYLPVGQARFDGAVIEALPRASRS